MRSRRAFLQGMATVAAAAAVQPVRAMGSDKKATGLSAEAFAPLPLGQVQPAGWLLRQLQIQANGMSGHLDEFWPDVGPNSGWLGGTGESWERGPYFLDGLLPLAYLLHDDRLKAKAKKFVDWTLENQQPNGMIGPKSNDDWWPRMVMVKCLMQWAEVEDDQRVIPVLTKYFHYQLAELPGRPLQSWGKFRWQDEVYVVEWLYGQTQDAKLLDLAALLQKQGFDWTGLFANYPYTKKVEKTWPKGHPTDAVMATHGVNNSQGLKCAAVQYRMSGSAKESQAFVRQMHALDTYHGMPNGMFSCDEHLAGTMPQQGTELCSVVETMFSLEIALATFGDAWIADRIEKIAYNALPGTFTDDMWAHQYDQEPNQLNVGIIEKPFPWTSDGPQSNMYGLEPHFGCCTANYHQGWPKFTASLWMRSPEDGLVAALLAPSVVSTTVRGAKVRVTEETEYPFRGAVKFTVEPEKAVAFPLSVRIPAWAGATEIKVNGKTQVAAAAAGGFTKLQRTWKAGDVVEMNFAMTPRVVRGYNRSVSLERGPVVFSFNPGEDWTKLRDRGMTADWKASGTKDWNLALAVDETNVAKLQVMEQAVGAVPFARAQNAVTLQAPAKLLASWKEENGFATAPPVSPVASDAPEQTVTLIPYAAAKLRVTSFPSLRS
jgi:hypothetical protein